MFYETYLDEGGGRPHWSNHKKYNFFVAMRESNLFWQSTYIPVVPRKWFRSADCDTIYTIYLSRCTQSADPNHLEGRPVHDKQQYNYEILLETRKPKY